MGGTGKSCARVSLALLSLKENEGIVVIYLRSFKGSYIYQATFETGLTYSDDITFDKAASETHKKNGILPSIIGRRGG